MKSGYTYGAYSSFNPHRYAGSFGVGTFTKTETTVPATKLVVDLLTKMSSGEITQGELDFARDYLAGVYPIQSETAERVADRIVTVAEFGLPADYNDTYPDRIRSVTSKQVEEMAQRYLETKDLDIVLVGNVGAFREALKKDFPSAQYVEIPFEQVDLLAADLRKPKESAAAAPANPEAAWKRGKRFFSPGRRLPVEMTFAMLRVSKSPRKEKSPAPAARSNSTRSGWCPIPTAHGRMSPPGE